MFVPTRPGEEAFEQRLISGEPPVLLLDQDLHWDPPIALGLVALQRAEQLAGTPDGHDPNPFVSQRIPPAPARAALKTDGSDNPEQDVMPHNRGTLRNPRYVGLVSYKGHTKWVGTHPSIAAYKQAEQERLCRCARASRTDSYGLILQGAILAIGEAAMRPGEIFALNHNDIDFAAGLIHVRRQLDLASGVTDWPKDDEPRDIAMSPRLRSHLEIMPRLSEEILFPTPRGCYMWARRFALAPTSAARTGHRGVSALQKNRAAAAIELQYTRTTRSPPTAPTGHKRPQNASFPTPAGKFIPGPSPTLFDQKPPANRGLWDRRDKSLIGAPGFEPGTSPTRITLAGSPRFAKNPVSMRDCGRYGMGSDIARWEPIIGGLGTG